MDAPEQTLTRLAQGYQLSQALYVAAKLGVADRLGAGPLAAETIAEAVDARGPGSARMLARTLPVARELADSDVLRGARTLVDVGGGTGTVVAEVLSRNPAMRAVLLERAGVLALARAYLGEQGVADRCELVEGDFFASVPPGGDLYLLKSVLHDWPDERCVAILRNCAAAMGPDARLLIVDAVLADRMTGSANELPGALLDLMMLVYAGGRERTAAEFERLLDEAGLRLAAKPADLAAGLGVVQAARA